GSGDTQSDYSVTSRIDRLPSELTPAPLPPSPAAEAADVWFEQVPTNPAAVPDLNVLGGSRPDLGSAIGGSRSRFDTGSPAGRDPWAPPNYSTGPVQRLAAGRRAWLLPILLTATAIAVGMVLGALLFGGSEPPEKQLSIPADCPPAAVDPPAPGADAPAKRPVRSKPPPGGR
ncbi:MAG TPA: hypothetical protein VML75_13425, partial [Kofleriaceae bacterium]|nr:hypothetical protein [Kofleriaceae bacterium]